ncbi:MAG: carboxylating nicotinate-nucleotide diphosphorylase [Clostridia bacterium]|jgi:nicotinate-nucleotide pyrophosphorylase (carboxylating)|nr:carboxylating nicotinate-nucleotide diphosphorylase [Clostridia bacterium]
MNVDVTQKLHWDELILNALREDIPWEDVSANSVVNGHARGRVDLICKQDGVIAGLSVFVRTFALLDETAEAELSVQDGDEVKRGQKLGRITAGMRALLSGERTALNFLGRMSGIATYTRSAAKLLEGTHTKLLDTRKTTPGLRSLEKYAVRMGGGSNHRFNLSDGVLLKDNHIGAAGSVTAAIERARAYAPFVRKIEVEVETLGQLEEALAAGADIVMLDNMDDETLKQAVKLAKGRAETEISGNVTKENIAKYVSYGVDYISSGALTHSAPVLDLSLKNLKPLTD